MTAFGKAQGLPFGTPKRKLLVILRGAAFHLYCYLFLFLFFIFDFYFCFFDFSFLSKSVTFTKCVTVAS
jgi:hypothetical protein